MNGTSPLLPVQVLPQQQAPHLSPASTSFSITLSSHFQPDRRVQPHSSYSIRSIPRHLPKQVLLLDKKLQNGSFCVKHFPSSFHGDVRTRKEEKFKDACHLYSARELKKNVDVQSFNRKFDESGPPQMNYPSLATRLPHALEPEFPSASLGQSKNRDLNTPGNSDGTSSSKPDVVQPGSKSSSVSEHRRSRLGDIWQPGPRFEKSDRPCKKPLRRSSNRVASSNANPNSSKQIETAVESKNVFSNQTVRRSPAGGAHLLSNSNTTPISYGKSRTRVELAYRVIDKARSSQNGARPDVNTYRHTQGAGATGEAIAVLQNRLQRGIATGSSMYIKALQMCSQPKDLLAAQQVHDCIIESGMDKNPYVASTLLNVYIKCGELLCARRVFDELKKKSVINWNSMIAGYAKSDLTESALELFTLMRQVGARPNEVTYLSILKACASPSALKWGKEVHICIRNDLFESDVRVGTALLQMYANCGCITEARKVFEQLTNRNCVTWNVMIGAYAEHGSGMEAYQLFLQMRRDGFQPDAITYLSILNACASAGASEWVKEVHAHACKAGLESDVRVGNALVHMYAKSGSIDESRRIFDRMEKRDVVTWSAIIGGLAQHGCGHEAYRLFLQMRREGFEPNAFTYTSILNASASVGALEWVKEVHGHARKAGLESDVRVGSALVHMYANSGCIEDARLVFDKMKKRDVVAWTVMIAGLAQYGCGREAYRLFLQMRREGFQPDAITFVSILNSSASEGALEWVKKVHGHARNAGLDSDLRVGNALIDIYGKSGSIDDARLVFDRMEKRDLITWNIMIGSYAESGGGMEAYGLFIQMRHEGFEPDSFTYASILNASASVGALEWVKAVHGHAREAGLETDLRVCSALVHMYAKSGSIDDARLVFDRMEKRDLITWNIIIGSCAESGLGMEAYGLFLQMRREGFEPDAFTYASILSASASEGALEWVKDVHGHAREAGLESDLRVGSALVHMYAKSGSIDDARLVFDRMKKRELITWNIMIGSYAESGLGMEAYEMFLQMRREGFKPDTFTFASILNSSASVRDLDWVKEVHDHARKAGLELDLHVGSALVHIYAKSGSIDDARLLFDKMEKSDVVTWNIMISGLAQHGCGHEAYRLFLQMQREGFEPDVYTFVSIMNASVSAEALEWVKEVHGHGCKAGLELDVRVGSTLIHMYARSGSIDDARLLFDRMEKNDVVTWTVMIRGLAQHGCGHEALELFRKMILHGVEPNESSFLAVLSACCHGGLVDDGCRIFSAMMQDYGIEPEIVHYNCMVDLLGRAGHLEEAKRFISDMPIDPNGVTWTALLGACRTYGNMELGEVCANELFQLEPSRDSTYVLLSNIYAAAGKWEKVSLVRTMMETRGIRKEPGRTWIEVDNKIHEFVAGDTSHPEASAIYTELNKLIEKLKAEGYIPDTRVVLRDIIEEDKELALCSHSEKLAIAYGLMHLPREEPIRIRKNLRVCPDCHTASKFISKVTGREIIARDANRFHHFKDGMCSCGDYW